MRASRATDPVTVEALRQEIDRLRAELASARSSPPADAAQYAGGTDMYDVGVEYPQAGFGGTEYVEVSINWNSIFREVGPLLIEEASEEQMRKRLSQEVLLYTDKPEKYDRVYNRANVTNECFETIKIQLLALGLIKRSERKHVPSDTNRYWSLTPYGETLLMKLRAIPKTRPAQKQG